MRIAVNTRFLISGRMDGIARFTLETVKRITTAHPEHTFFFLFDRPFSGEFIFSGNIVPVVVSPPARHPLLWYAWYRISLPRWMKKVKPDLFFSPDGLLPAGTGTPMIPVIHDLNFEHFPEDLPFPVRNYYKRFMYDSAVRARDVITVSRFSRQDIADTYHIDQQKIHVAYNGVSAHFKPASPEEKKRIRGDISGGMPYILHTGSMTPRKNIPSLLRAFDLFRQDHERYKLILAGGILNGAGEVKHVLKKMKFRDEVIFTGRISEERLAALTAGAEALVLVSRFEGFGLPVAEAMTCRVPVVCSNTTALPETAGDAALLTDPFSVKNIAHHLSRITEDSGLRQSLIEKGNVQVKKFSWEKTANTVWDIISKNLSS